MLEPRKSGASPLGLAKLHIIVPLLVGAYSEVASVFYSFQINALSSVSMTSAIVSGLTVYRYQHAVHSILVTNFVSSMGFGKFTHFLDKDAPLKLTDQENTTVAITSLVAVFSIIEVALAVCAAWSSDSLYQIPQGNQISQVCEVFISHGGTRKKKCPVYTSQVLVA